MGFKDLIKISISSLSINKVRALLTMLGIIMGVSSIIIVLSVGDSAQNLILGEIKGFGANNVFVLPGKQPSGIMDIGGTLLNDSLKVADYKSLKKSSNVPDAINVIPYVFGPVTSSYASDIYMSTMMGSVPEMSDVFSIKLDSGRFFDNSDLLSNARVAVIGNKVREKIFGLQDPIGKKIKINKAVFVVIGVMNQKESGSSPIDLDKAIVAPYPSVQKTVLGIKYFNRIAVEASSALTINAVKKQVETTLRINHNISNSDDDDFFTQTQEEIAKSVSSIIDILAVLVASVASISLIVGGIGIMNVMFVSVVERRREIGLRKALGASNGDILKQFLTESIFLTFGGGVIGIIFGGAFTFFSVWAVNKFAGIAFPFSISLMGILLGVGVSVVIGVGFGIFPARSASKKTPMEAITYK